MTKYNEQLKDIFRSIPCPVPGFVVDVVEYKSYIGLRLYTNNVDNLRQSQKVSVAEYLYHIRDSFRAAGARCQFERVDGDPPTIQ